MKKLPLGLQTFRTLIEDNYLYIDKTRQIYNLLQGSSRYFFLSRPRRFGKSLLLSTLKEIFLGEQSLFKDLWIYPHWEWKTYPIIYIDFSGLSYSNQDELKDTLNYLITENAKANHIHLTEKNYDKSFRELISKLAKKEKVVILIDEYDKPLIDYIENKDIAAANRDILRNFYSAIKSADQYLRFVFITGVSKFSKVSVFSGLNNLTDITVDTNYSTLLGYTKDELIHYFSDRFAEFSQPKSNVLKNITQWYNGYSWDGQNFLYNPFSILNFFEKKEFNNYWFSSGTPTFLIKLIKEKSFDIQSLTQLNVDHTILDSFDMDNIDIITLLFQTGYLTLKKIQKVGLRSRYTLSYPNEEVKEAFLKYLLADYTESSPPITGNYIFEMVEALMNQEVNRFIGIIQTVFSAIPYNIFIQNKEAYYHTVIYLVLTLLGVHIESEIQTHSGRIDAVIQTISHIYVLEFKMGNAADTLDQIKNKQYYQKYLSKNKKIILLGIGFDANKKNISDYLSEEFHS
jgi:hypothetical protein